MTSGGTLTLEMVMESIRAINAIPGPFGQRSALLSGVRIIETSYALEATSERNFPESRHRSMRVHKKLVKRFGSEFRMVPAAWMTPDGIVVHPARYAEIKKVLARQIDRMMHDALLGVP